MCKRGQSGNIDVLITDPSDILTQKNNATVFWTENKLELKFGENPHVNIILVLNFLFCTHFNA